MKAVRVRRAQARRIKPSITPLVGPRRRLSRSRGFLMRHALAFAALFPCLSGAFAADAPSPKLEAKPAPEASNSCFETRQVPNDAFGFAAGSDVNGAGDKTVGLEYGGAFGTRFGTAQSHGLKLGVEWSPLRCFDMTPWISGGWSRAHDDVTGTRDRARAFGAGMQVNYKILGRDVHGVGLTLSVEPSGSWGRARSYDPSIPATLRWSQTAYGAAARVILDKELIENRLYAAFNLENAASFLKANGVDCATNSGSAYCRSSQLNFRAALSAKAMDNLFVGVDGSHQRVYDGAFLNRRPGYAWFAGPNVYWQIADGLSLNAAWSTQLSGRAPGQHGGRLNLDQFTRDTAKVKIQSDF
jgi:hypothetical protein